MLRPVINWIFVISLTMGLLMIAIMAADTVPNSGGLAHPEHAGMQVGDDGAERLDSIGVFAFLFQSLLLSLVVCLSILGVSERRRSPQLLALMGASLIFMLFVWWQMYSGHQAYLATGETGYFMGFPTATAWQVYGTWLGAIPLILIYSIGFRKYIYTKEDEAAFNKLLMETRAKNAAAKESR
ncbi:MAG: hypothetical protein MI746_10280 [Pseudomonadales bacterium]|nr:hypothetical protein [Pseudomonadales bacterium]